MLKLNAQYCSNGLQCKKYGKIELQLITILDKSQTIIIMRNGWAYCRIHQHVAIELHHMLVAITDGGIELMAAKFQMHKQGSTITHAGSTIWLWVD